MNICQALTWAARKLNHQTQSANLDAEILLCYIINKNKTFLYTYPEQQLNIKQINNFKKLINRRLKGEPVAYLINHKGFYGLNFIVNKSVLIPRPETELIVKEILNNKDVKTIADIGTGSGCIAISLAKKNSHLKVYASDISQSALKIAQQNSKHHQVNKSIIFKLGNLLEPFKNIKLDAIVANLPYLDNKLKKDTLDNNETIGLKFEPSIALYSGKDGLNCYRQLIQQIKHLKDKPQYIYLEINPHQATAIKNIIKVVLPSTKISIRKDLTGLNRLVIVYLN